ncbi:proline-rich protein 2-like [Onychostruthus taczanowskii]|uniref:proline-rich protein 2-like n=1 Tax=Onychostruthus taczanowskii TaxID=356909 RepID=UPI001B7FF103|nr:proline-rich protein 2-like [Onychostruthus taczanowskii]
MAAPGHRPARRRQRPAPGWARAACQPRRPGDLSRLRGTGLTPSSRGSPGRKEPPGAAPPTSAAALGLPEPEEPRQGPGPGAGPGPGPDPAGRRRHQEPRQGPGPGPGPDPAGRRRHQEPGGRCSPDGAERLLGGCGRPPLGGTGGTGGTFPSPQPRSGVPRGGGGGGTDPRLLCRRKRVRDWNHRVPSAATGAGNCPRPGTPRLDPQTTEGPPTPHQPRDPVFPRPRRNPRYPGSGAPPDPPILPPR